jgi:hypothetical protein
VRVVGVHDAPDVRHAVEFAVRADGSCPAGEFMQKLKAGTLEGDSENDGDLPSDAQVSDYHKFLAACLHLARYGEPKNRTQVNDLDDGVWEFKSAKKRVSWYDTDGEGGYTPKLRIRDRRMSPFEESDFWWFPDFDWTIRLGHSFVKHTPRTDPSDLALSQQIRDEDVAHDQP